MANIMPKSELVRRAAVWICEEHAVKNKTLHACLDEAGMRFNLSPNDQKMLAELFADNDTVCSVPSGRPD